MFALARDNALPFSETIRRTNKRKQPTFAIWSVIGLCIPFACLPLGSATTLYSVLAVTASTLSYVGYVSVSLPCAVSPLRRVHQSASTVQHAETTTGRPRFALLGLGQRPPVRRPSIVVPSQTQVRVTAATCDAAESALLMTPQ